MLDRSYFAIGSLSHHPRMEIEDGCRLYLGAR